MKLLEERIRTHGKIREGGVLKVDSFLNHQMDVKLFQEMGKEFLRWIRPEDEYHLINALARLWAARQTDLEEGAPLIGAFRACGLLVPVWELVPGTEADELAKPAAAFDERLKKALADTSPLTNEQKRARDGLISRQVNLR